MRHTCLTTPAAIHCVSTMRHILTNLQTVYQLLHRRVGKRLLAINVVLALSHQPEGRLTSRKLCCVQSLNALHTGGFGFLLGAGALLQLTVLHANSAPAAPCKLAPWSP